MMRSVDELIEMFRAYRNAKIWMMSYLEDFKLLEHKLRGNLGGSIITTGDGGQSNESYRRSSVNDEMNRFILENEKSYERYDEILKCCDHALSRMDLKHRPLIEDIYLYGMKVSNASAKYGYNRNYIYELVKRELEKVVNNETSR